MSILDAIGDPNLFKQWFRDPETWAMWRVFLCALFGLEMTDEQFAIYQHHTGRTARPTQAYREAWMAVGRRGGKSFIAALIAVYLATFRDYRPFLQPGEKGTLAVLAKDKRQARTILRYCQGFFQNIPMLKAKVTNKTAMGFELDNSVVIEIAAASFRGTRGYTYIGVLADEIAFWQNENSANPDFEILTAVKPGLVTVPNAPLICLSSTYARKGELWRAKRKFWGRNDAPLFWQATTREANPTVPQSFIDEAMERDPAAAAAEYLSQFRSDIEAFLSREVVDACTILGQHELPPITGTKYFGFVDPSGGSADAYTLAIAHNVANNVVLDAVREERPPFSPQSVTAEFAALLKTYNVKDVCGDRYAGEWPREQFRNHGINYVVSEKTRSDLYRDLLPELNSRRVQLLDIEKLATQLVTLERRTARGGRDSIDHAPGAHDDLANAVAGVVDRAKTKKGNYWASMMKALEDSSGPTIQEWAKAS